MLIIKNLSYSYNDGAEYVLENLSLHIDKEGIYTIEGENGSGKSTFLKILASIAEKSLGEISLCGIPLGEREYKRKVGYIPDTPILYDELTGAEHITLFAELWEMTASEKKEYQMMVGAMVRCLSLDKFMNQKVRTLSFGTKYKLFFVLMLSRKPKLLLLDEPFSSLDIKSQEKAVHLIKKYSEEAIVIMSSHQKNIIDALSEHRYLLKNRKLNKEA